MKYYIAENEIFLNYDNRSVEKYHPELSAHLWNLFGLTTSKDPKMIAQVIQEAYNWAADKFRAIISGIDDMLFVDYLFAYHEASVHLWMRVLNQEDIEGQFGISEDALSLNRRILRLALEQTTVVNYIRMTKASAAQIKIYDAVIEDLIYIGAELHHFGQFLAEMRMIPNTCYFEFDNQGLFRINRPAKFDAIFNELFLIMKDDFKKGIADTNGVYAMKDEIKKCFGIDYDATGSLIVQIKKHHSPNAWEFQTIEQGILTQNLIHSGVSADDAKNFLDGLTLNKANKLSVKESVYKVNSMERHFFRPILEISQNGKIRQLIGIEKWAESIMVLVTNGFQWNKSSTEWKNNACFQKYLNKKSDEHDSLLDDEVEKVLKANNLPFVRNIKSVTNGVISKRVDISAVGEMDFVWIDTKRSVIAIADCKYSRARYDMIAFSADFTTFHTTYEVKLINKKKWIENNKQLVCEHFRRLFPNLANMGIEKYDIVELFIINTPTFYMYSGNLNTVCFFKLEEFLTNNYYHPDIAIKIEHSMGTRIEVVTHPYF